jgi:hypothetical protein
MHRYKHNKGIFLRICYMYKRVNLLMLKKNKHNNNIRKTYNSNNYSRIRNLMTVAAIVTVTTISTLSFMHMTILKQNVYAWTQYDAYFFQTGEAEGKNNADSDYNNNCRFCNQWEDNVWPCNSGDFKCLEITGWRIGYFDEWCNLTNECMGFYDHVE